jgi:hypothetical protein
MTTAAAAASRMFQEDPRTFSSAHFNTSHTPRRLTHLLLNFDESGATSWRAYVTRRKKGCRMGVESKD